MGLPWKWCSALDSLASPLMKPGALPLACLLSLCLLTQASLVQSTEPQRESFRPHSREGLLRRLLRESPLVLEAVGESGGSLRVTRVLKGKGKRSGLIYPEDTKEGKGRRTLREGSTYFFFLRRAPRKDPGGGVLLRKSRRLSKDIRRLLCKMLGPRVEKLHSNTSSSGKVSEGHLLLLKCRLSCSPSPHTKTGISWFKNGETLRPSSRLKIKRNGRQESLRIPLVRLKDKGLYECHSTSSKRNASSSMGLHVRVIPKKRLLKYFDSKRFLRGSSCPLSSYCLNGGKCVYYRGLGELSCICASGFKGKRCEHKDLYDRAVSLKPGLSLACVLGVTHYYPC